MTRFLLGSDSKDGVAIWYDGMPGVHSDYTSTMKEHWRPAKMHTLHAAIADAVLAVYPLEDYNGNVPSAFVQVCGMYVCGTL